MLKTHTKHFSIVLIALVIPLLFTACIPLPIPHYANVTPLVTGTVLDEATNEPIGGAEVRISASPSSKAEATHITTDSTGRFEGQVNEFKWWFVIWLGPYDRICTYGLSAQHPAFETVHDGEQFIGSCSSWTRTRNLKVKRTVSKQQELPPKE